jgi:hypothetical protein
MTDPADQVREVGEIAEQLADLGLHPVLIGGMALVALGSRRVTRDFDFVIADPVRQLEAMLDLFYSRGLELVSRINVDGDVASTIDNQRVASIRLRIDKPGSAFFFSAATQLRIDLLFDFPVPAVDLLNRAKTRKVRSHIFHIASDEDLLRLKKMAYSDRKEATDAQDIEFLEARKRRRDSEP